MSASEISCPGVSKRSKTAGHQHAKAGRSADEVVKAAPTKEFDAKRGVTDASGFVRQAYGGVLARRS